MMGGMPEHLLDDFEVGAGDERVGGGLEVVRLDG
jgi:hypothetical protein